MTTRKKGAMEKGAGEALDYEWDWTKELRDGETIQAVTFVTPPVITVYNSSFTGTTVTAWISGGVKGSRYEVICRITTALRVRERVIEFLIVS